MIQPLYVFSDVGIAVLRVVLGLIMIAHGWPKIKNIKGTAAWMGEKFKPGIFWAIVVSVVEFVGGIFLIAGFLTQIVSAIIAIQFVVIIIAMKRGKGLVDGYEFDLLILAAALALLVLGGGHYGLDNLWGILIY
jgi:putative oxidoreductase